jgi:hypothetical protein
VPNIDTPRERRRAGTLWLAGGVILLAVGTTLSVLTGNWRWLLDTSPAILLSLTLALVLLTTPPDVKTY